MSIQENVKHWIDILPQDVRLIAVSKTHSPQRIMDAFASGQRAFGENYVQEFMQKAPSLPSDIEWHFIGHLQSNKVKQMLPWVHWIHAVDSMKLLREIEKHAEKNNRRVQVLLQMHIASEETKFGMNPQELDELLEVYLEGKSSNILLRGLMGMASFSENEALVRGEFRKLKTQFDAIGMRKHERLTQWDTLSMGMSGDWRWAEEEGSTMVRIGSAIFGERNYTSL
ncbi:MAG: YggS family pyridoxal phosphate-dependent enzyme [Flavobacteriales bacterium]